MKPGVFWVWRDKYHQGDCFVSPYPPDWDEYGNGWYCGDERGVCVEQVERIFGIRVPEYPDLMKVTVGKVVTEEYEAR